MYLLYSVSIRKIRVDFCEDEVYAVYSGGNDDEKAGKLGKKPLMGPEGVSDLKDGE